MRNNLILCVALVLTLNLVSCGKSDSEKLNDQQSQENTEKSSKDPFGLFNKNYFCSNPGGINPGVGRTLTITTFNIKFYGLGGNFNGSFTDETRDPDINSFISAELKDSDVIVFQEIVDAARFVKNAVPSDYFCTTYDHGNIRHQKVILCHKDHLEFKKPKGESNFIIDDVAINVDTSRPALHGILSEKNGKDLAYLVGVHLKSSPSYSDTRRAQAETIAKEGSKLMEKLPVILIGDFNTYQKGKKFKKNGQEQILNEDDEFVMSGIFNQYGMNVCLTKGDYKNTYRSSKYTGLLDHIWIGKKLHVRKKPSIYPACDPTKTTNDPKSLKNIDVYNSKISDHCPLSVEVGGL